MHDQTVAATHLVEKVTPDRAVILIAVTLPYADSSIMWMSSVVQHAINERIRLAVHDIARLPDFHPDRPLPDAEVRDALALLFGPDFAGDQGDRPATDHAD